MSTHRKLAKSAGTIGILTSVSRVLGFVRDMIIATLFGTSAAAEAFVVSFKIPNLLRDLVGEGATNAAFVPVLTECRQKRPEDYWRLVSTLFSTMSLILVLLSFLGMVFAPEVVHLIAPGFAHSADPEKMPMTIAMTRVIFPYVVLIGLSALAMGVLNSLKEFTSSALGPCLMNLSMIAAGLFLENRFGPMALVMGVLLGGVFQLGCQIPPLLKAGFRLDKPMFGDPVVKRIGKLLIPRALGSALYQINVFVDSILASFDKIVGAGGQSALYYSNRLFQLPLAIFGIALAQAVLPTFSSQAVAEDRAGFRRTLALSLRTLTMVVLPAAIGLLVMCYPIVRIVFQRGQFDEYSTHITAQALFFYSFGLLSCCYIKILANAFYALQDTRTPVKTAMVSVGLNVALSLLFMGPFKIGGLTLASSISATVNVVLLYRVLSKKIGSIPELHDRAFYLKLIFAGLLMACVCMGYQFFVLDPNRGASTLMQALLLALGIAISAAVYFGAAYALKIQELHKILSWVRR